MSSCEQTAIAQQHLEKAEQHIEEAKQLTAAGKPTEAQEAYRKAQVEAEAAKKAQAAAEKAIKVEAKLAAKAEEAAEFARKIDSATSSIQDGISAVDKLCNNIDGFLDTIGFGLVSDIITGFEVGVAAIKAGINSIRKIKDTITAKLALAGQVADTIKSMVKGTQTLIEEIVSIPQDIFNTIQDIQQSWIDMVEEVKKLGLYCNELFSSILPPEAENPDEGGGEEGSGEEGSGEEGSGEEGSGEEGSGEEGSGEEGSGEEGSGEEGSGEEGSGEEGSDEEGSDEEGSDEEGSGEEESEAPEIDQEAIKQLIPQYIIEPLALSLEDCLALILEQVDTLSSLTHLFLTKIYQETLTVCDTHSYLQNNFSTVMLTAADTPELIAQKFFGSPDYASVILSFNNISSFEAIEPGTILRIPLPSHKNNSRNRVFNFLNYDLLGKDIALDDQGFILTTGSNLSLIKGADNLKQALILRLKENVSKRIRLFIYGIRASIADPLASVNFITGSIYNTVMQDPRIQSVDDITFRTRGDSIFVSVSYTTSTGDSSTIAHTF